MKIPVQVCIQWELADAPKKGDFVALYPFDASSCRKYGTGRPREVDDSGGWVTVAVCRYVWYRAVDWDGARKEGAASASADRKQCGSMALDFPSNVAPGKFHFRYVRANYSALAQSNEIELISKVGSLNPALPVHYTGLAANFTRTLCARFMRTEMAVSDAVSFVLNF